MTLIQEAARVISESLRTRNNDPRVQEARDAYWTNHSPAINAGLCQLNRNLETLGSLSPPEQCAKLSMPTWPYVGRIERAVDLPDLEHCGRQMAWQECWWFPSYDLESMCQLSGPYAVLGLVLVHTPRLLDEVVYVQLDAGDGHQLFMTVWLNAFGENVPQEARRPWWDTDRGMSSAIGRELHVRRAARPRVTKRWLLDIATNEQPIRYREQEEWKERAPWPEEYP